MEEDGDEKATIIKGGRLIDGTGADPIDDSVISIKGNEIKQISRKNDVSFPDRARVIDADGRIVVPGLIDSHLHLWGLGTDRIVDELLMVPEGVRLVRASKRVGLLLDAGFTTVKDCGGTNALHIKRAIAEGTLHGPRIIAAGYFLNQTFGHGDFFHFLPNELSDVRTAGGRGSSLTCDGVGECMKAARFALREGADFIKICTSGGVMSERDRSEHVQFTFEEVKAIVQVAKNVGTFVTAHCQSAEGMRMSIEAGVKTIDHAFYPDDQVIEMGKKNETVFVSTLSIMKRYNEGGIEAGYPEWAVRKSKEAWDKVIINIKKLRDADAILAAGTDFLDSNLMRLGTNSLELELLVKYCGFKPIDAIKAATQNGAKACGLEHKTGTVEEGKAADVIILEKDPLGDIGVLQNPENIRLVMKEGVVEVDKGL